MGFWDDVTVHLLWREKCADQLFRAKGCGRGRKRWGKRCFENKRSRILITLQTFKMKSSSSEGTALLSCISLSSCHPSSPYLILCHLQPSPLLCLPFLHSSWKAVQIADHCEQPVASPRGMCNLFTKIVMKHSEVVKWDVKVKASLTPSSSFHSWVWKWGDIYPHILKKIQQ